MAEKKSEKRTVSQNVLDMVYIISCALHDIEPEENLVRTFDLKGIFKLSADQSIGSITFMGLQKSEYFKHQEADLYKQWQKYQQQALKKNLLLDYEREKLSAFLEEKGIWFMPLKGSVLQHIYPTYGMRQMGDNDILFDVTRRCDVRDYMVENGFEVDEFEVSHHDTYFKPPMYNFEMHTQLLGNKNSEVWLKYYEEVKDRLILKEGSSFEYCFSDEDFYIYQVLHSYKHYIVGSIGIRHLLDTYVYLTAKRSNMDMDKIYEDLKKLDAYKFDDCAVRLSNKLFSEVHHLETGDLKRVLTADEFNMLYVMTLSDTYGTEQSLAEADFELTSQKVGGESKLKYYMKRAFPDDEWWRRSCPFAYRHKWAKPFYTIYRFVRGVTVRRKKLASEINRVNENMD